MNRLKIITSLIILIFTSISIETSFANDEPINIAMTAAFVSEEGTSIYKEIANYIQNKTKLKTNFITGLSYSTVNAMVEDGAAQIAFICGYPYVLSHDYGSSTKNRILVAPVMKSKLYENKPIYYSYVIVNKDSEIQDFKELKDKVWVYNDKASNSGYNMPRAKLIEIGEMNGFFKKVLHSGSHEESIRMVANGQADASAVDSLVLDYAKKNW